MTSELPLAAFAMHQVPPAFQVKQLEQRVATMEKSFICAFNQVLDLKDLNTGVHSTRLAEWALRVGTDLGLDESEIRDLEIAALLHDIGKIGVPDAILRKPGPLNAEERALMNKHPEYSWAILRLFPGYERVSLFALHHHESYDGTGYPAKLRGTEIPIGSRVVSVIDSFDAMVSNRPYRQGLPVEEAIRRLIQGTGKQFDPQITDCFLKIAYEEMNQVFEAAGTSMQAVL